MGVATSLYGPGSSLRPARRPVNRNFVMSGCPVNVKLPRSVTSRVQRWGLGFFGVGFTQVRGGERRPGRDCTTVKRTVASSLRVTVTSAPYARLRAASALGPDGAAGNAVGVIRSLPTVAMLVP